MNRLIVFYSYSGNTKSIVDRICDKYKYDVAEIKPKEAYDSDYDKVVSSEEKLVPLDYQPDIQPLNIDLNLYDEIILCTPVWWYSVASPVNTFLHQYDLSQKTIIPVATNGGWLGRAFENIEKITGASLKKAISLKFENKHLSNLYELEDWLNKLEESKENI